LKIILGIGLDEKRSEGEELNFLKKKSGQSYDRKGVRQEGGRNLSLPKEWRIYCQIFVKESTSVKEAE